MKLCRFTVQDRAPRYGIIEGDEVAAAVGDLAAGFTTTSERYALAAVRLLAPATPSKVIAVGLNYLSHLGDQPPLRDPGLFFKPPSATVGPDETILLPRDAGRVDYEGELVAVIGRTARDVPEESALDHVFGFTCGNDISAREWQKNDLQWWRAKGTDTFGPMGPWIVTGLDPRSLELWVRVNGELVQHTTTDLMINSVARIVAFAARRMTLLPGDVIYTGTPGEPRQAHPGETCEVEISGIGVLHNNTAWEDEGE